MGKGVLGQRLSRSRELVTVAAVLPFHEYANPGLHNYRLPEGGGWPMMTAGTPSSLFACNRTSGGVAVVGPLVYPIHRFKIAAGIANNKGKTFKGPATPLRWCRPVRTGLVVPGIKGPSQEVSSLARILR